VHARHHTESILAPRTGKFIKNGHNVFESGENLLQNGMSVRNRIGTLEFM